MGRGVQGVERPDLGLFLGASLSCGMWPAGHLVLDLGHFSQPVRFVFRPPFWRRGDEKDLEWFSSWRKGDEWNPRPLPPSSPRRFCATTSILALPCGPEIFLSELRLESLRLTSAGRTEGQWESECTWEDALEGAPSWLADPPPNPKGQGLILLNGRFWESAGSRVNGGRSQPLDFRAGRGPERLSEGNPGRT